jgi:hypothetical protein
MAIIINKHKYKKTSKVTSTQIKFEEETGYTVLGDVANNTKIAAVCKYHMYMLEPVDKAPPLDFDTILAAYDANQSLMAEVGKYLGEDSKEGNE